MTYDTELADRLRQRLAGNPSVTERAMFGGLAFMLHGHMTVTASRTGGLMVRADPSDAAELLATTPAQIVEMGDRTMHGWLRLDVTDVDDDEVLDEWVQRAVAFVSTLPPK